MFIGANADEFAVWDSSFNRRLIVDQSGRVKMPNQPGFGGYVSAQRTSNGTYINFSTLLGNWNQGGHFNASTGVFTAPVGGRYLITVTGKSDNSSTTTRGLVRLFVNGYQDVGSAQLLQLAANDTLYTTIEGASAGTPFRVAFGAILLG
jgi:hypothetical protein